MTENVLDGLKRAHKRMSLKSEQEKQNIIQKQRQSLKNSVQKRTAEEQKLVGEHISNGRHSSEKCKSSWNKNIQAKNWQTEQHKIHLLQAVSKPKTKEQRNKLSETRKSSGIAKGAKNPNAKAVMCVSTGEIFSWAGEASEKLGLNVKEIRKCCQGTRKHIKGLIFKYVENNIC